MKRFFIIASSLLTVSVIGILGIVFWEKSAESPRADIARQAVAHAADTASIDHADVHGRPAIMYSALNLSSTVYVNLSPSGDVDDDFFIISGVTDDDYESTQRFTTFPYPSSDAAPAPDDDGSFTPRAFIDGMQREFSAAIESHDDISHVKVTDDQGNLVADWFDDTGSIREIAHISATDRGILVESTYE